MSVATLDQFFDGTMRPSVVVETLSNFQTLFPVRTVRRGPELQPLPVRRQQCPPIAFEDRGKNYDLYDFLATNRVAGLLVLKDGEVALEMYELGMVPQTRWASCSIAKSITATLVGAAIADGAIASIDDPVETYVTALRGSDYASVTVRQVLQMSSGIAWSEVYTDRNSDRRRLLEAQARHQPGAILEHMRTLKRAAPAGTVCNYNTGESYVIGAIVEAATGRNLADYLSEKIWSVIGMEDDATWWVEGAKGMVMSGGGMSATLRDYGRFGQFVLDGGRVNGRSILPANWCAEAGSAQMIGGKTVPYGYMWWIPELEDPILAGSFQAEGVFGQYIHVNPAEKLVVVLLSARAKPSFVSRLEFNDDAFFAGIARSLR